MSSYLILIHYGSTIQYKNLNRELIKMTIKFKHAYKSFGNKIIFKDASININRNSIYFIMSPNGSGKTTLFKIIKNFSKIKV